MDVSQVPRPAGVVPAGTSRWQEKEKIDWDSIIGYVAGVYWTLLAMFEIYHLTQIPNGFALAGLNLVYSIFMAYAYYARPDWAQLAVRYISAVGFFFSLIGLFLAFGASSVLRDEKLQVIAQILFVSQCFSLVMSVIGLYLSREDGIF